MKIAVCLIFCLSLLGLSATCQDCKYTVNKVDALTGQKILKAKVKINFVNQMDFAKTGDEMRVESFVYLAGEKNFVLPAGSLLDLKLGNDKILTLLSAQDAAPSTYLSATATSAQVYSIYGMSYIIDQDQAADIVRYGIKYCRTHLSGETYYEHNFSEKETEKTKVSANCVFNEGKGFVKPKLTVASASPAPPKKESDESLIEEAIRKKKEKKAREEAELRMDHRVQPAPPQVKDTAKVAPKPAVAAPVKAASPTPASATTPAPVQVVPLSGADELMKWKKLLDQGIITKEEFEAQKKKILGN